MKTLSETLANFGLELSTVVLILAVIGGWIAASWTVERIYKRKLGTQLGRQLIQLFLTALGLLLLLLLMPLPPGVRSELINLIGIVLSATIALSSTTFLSNAMAGVMLRAVRNFQAGDLIQCGDFRGRVSERGLFHVEIQSENSDLITLPNLFLVTHPVRVTKEAGTIVSAEVSLGYDLPHTRIEELLIEAAREVGLEKSFVWILELGDFSVLYRVAGMLRPAVDVLSARSQLNAAMLDHLHRGGVEIVSPTFMNQRRLPLEQPMIPPENAATTEAESRRRAEPPEEVVFAKAKDAASLEKQQAELDTLDAEIRELEKQLANLAKGSERNGTAARLERRRRRERTNRAAILARRQADATPKEG